MIVNEYLSWRRKWARITPVSDTPDCRLVPDHADRHADRTALAEEIDKLTKRQRAVIVLRYYADLSDADIAAELGCSEGAVRNAASRALRSLRVELADLPILTWGA
jgi:RNA polymerase sigma factor (sigma-70 family)